MELDRLLADPELAADLPVREPARHSLEHCGLALAERIGPDHRSGALLGLRAPDGEGRARQRGPEHRRQVDRLDGLHDVAARAALAGRVDLLGIAVAREDHGRDRRLVLAQPLEARESVELRHAQVEEHHVRLVLAHGRKHVAADGDLVNDLEIGCVRQCAPDRGQHQPMVVRNEYSKRCHLYS
jgi:hypothetical protein